MSSLVLLFELIAGCFLLLALIAAFSCDHYESAGSGFFGSANALYVIDQEDNKSSGWLSL